MRSTKGANPSSPLPFEQSARVQTKGLPRDELRQAILKAPINSLEKRHGSLRASIADQEPDPQYNGLRDSAERAELNFV